ncbi:3',5'-cyclic-nucleotide phosphodiesterase [Vreelandella boliviensis]|uniref:3',5'-cyclic-nucleotide phosphodiesterase 1 n=1 Tax=Vreelandella boliviensis LC1 TaxID=1072583 RepID=A0A7U9C2H2_9GAMM|nr:3',5'-cyclic-nucleotide phosphodiesterase [Halomonas boliviensis]EHJ93709.1 3',5'-cyclic-nucleotide phosphodiesterase 1 [Halomonas boliviensis LC1]
MNVNVLGASGGLESSQGTSAFLLNPSTLLDAGTGVNQLSNEQLGGLKNILLTHAHIDHIASLPLLIDSLFETLVSRRQALTVYALPDVIKALQSHIFNHVIWPDFAQLPSPEQPVLRYVPITHWHPYTFDATVAVTPFPVTHGVPACGYWISCPTGTVGFSGDTGLSDITIQSLNRLGALDTLVIECAFPNHLDRLAESAYHLTPQRLAKLFYRVATPPKKLLITHLKPPYRSKIIQQLHAALPTTQPWQAI